MSKNSTRHTVKKLPALLAAFLLIASILLLTGCGNSGIKTAAQAAYQAAGSPDAENVSVYHFRGLDGLNAQTGTTLEETFAIEANQVPENGYVFIFEGNETIYVLMDESCAVVKSANFTALMNSLSANNAQQSAWIKQVNTDYAAGKMTDFELETQKRLMAEASKKNLAIATQCKLLATYGVASTTLGDPYDKDEINTWHDLTPNLIRSLR